MILRRDDGYELSDDPERVDLELTWSFLREAYWSPNVPREIVERALAGSLTLGLYAPDGAQAGLVRAVTDSATFAWIADAFVVAEHRGRGLGVWMVESLLDHPDLQGLRQVLLATRDAHGLYERFGFEPVTDRLMVRATSAAELYGTPAEKLSE